MIDGMLLAAVLLAATAAGLATLRALRALPGEPAEHLLAGAAVGLGVAGFVGLMLAAMGHLRPVTLAAAGVIALGLGGRDLLRALAAAVRSRPCPWMLLLPCGLVLATEVVTMLAPPVGGDQTKYQLVYPRLYGAAGGLVATPWSFWGHMQYLPNFLFAVAFALRGDVLARMLNGGFGVLAALALATLTRRHLDAGRASGATVGAVFFTLPITWSLMTRAGSDLPIVLYAALGASAVLDWAASAETRDLRRAAVMAGLAGGVKLMALLVPALLGVAVLVVLARRAIPFGRALGLAVLFAGLALLVASPCFVRNAVDTGNPIYPFGYGLFGGRHWSAAASDYLADYYRAYRATWAVRREGAPYAGLAVARFPWDLTMHPASFEKGAQQSLDIGPFVLAFAPALLLVRRPAVLGVGALGLAYGGIIAGGAWAHPRYVLPGVALLLAAAVPAAELLVGRRLMALVVAATVILNLGVTARLLKPLWPDQARVALGRLGTREFLRRHSDRYAFWERANRTIPRAGKVLVLEKIPHPYYIDGSFVLGSYLEQGLLDYRTLDSPAALAGAARLLGVSHVAVDMEGLEAAGDPFEAQVSGLWRTFLAEECDVVLRAKGYGLYVLKESSALVRSGSLPRG